MNEKITNLISELTTEIENYIQTEIAARTSNSSLPPIDTPFVSSEVVTTNLNPLDLSSDQSTPAVQLESTTGDTPLTMPTFDSNPIQNPVSVAPLPEPTPVSESEFSTPTTPDNSLPELIMPSNSAPATPDVFNGSANDLPEPDAPLTPPTPAPEFASTPDLTPASEFASTPESNSAPQQVDPLDVFATPVNFSTPDNSSPFSDASPAPESSLAPEITPFPESSSLPETPQLDPISNNQDDSPLPASPAFASAPEPTPEPAPEMTPAPTPATTDSNPGFAKAKGLLSRVLKKD